MRKRATQSQKRDRVRFVMDALARDYPDDLIVQTLMKQGMSQKQAGRYLKDAYQELGLLAIRYDPVLLGKAVHRANKLAKEVYQAALTDDDPEGKKARASVIANKSAVDIVKTIQSMGNNGNGKKSQSVSQSTEADELEGLLQLFGEQQAVQ